MSEARPSLYPDANHQFSTPPAERTSNTHPSAPPAPSLSYWSMSGAPAGDSGNVMNSSHATAPEPSDSYDPLLNNLKHGTSFKHEFETLPPDYELVLQVDAKVSEKKTSKKIVLKQAKQGTLRVIQGPMPPTTPEQAQSQQIPSYHAFMSIDDINIPLLSTCGASRVNYHSFYISIPNHTFLVELNQRTETELVSAFEALLKWFCQWQVVTDNGPPSCVPPKGVVAATPNANHMTDEIFDNNDMAMGVGNEEDMNALNKKQSRIEKLTKAGDKGVEMVERVGTLINGKINESLDKRRERILTEQEEGKDTGRQVKLGGKITNSLLLTTRKVVGAGANVASKVTDKISSHVGNAISTSSMSRNLSTAPEHTMKRKFYDSLMEGALVFGKVYVEVDRQSKIIISDAGDRMSEIANKKYGTEAEMAARNISAIALDGYRISRFPQKLGATSIVRGAFKSRFGQDSHLSTASADRLSDNVSGGVARHPHSYPLYDGHHDNNSRDVRRGKEGYGRGHDSHFRDISEEDAI